MNAIVPSMTRLENGPSTPRLITSNCDHGPSAELVSPDTTLRPHKDQSSLRDIWTKSFGSPDKRLVLHESTSVLLLFWGEGADFDATDEVTKLKDVFERVYRFDVTTAQLATETDNPTLDVCALVSAFARKQDKKNGLLIVYYAGHGGKSKVQSDMGNILLSGRNFDDTTKEARTIEWLRVEANLMAAKSDVLQIFDCCHAGLLCKPFVRSVSRSFEVLAACGARELTPAPGESSFTTAMTWALKELSVQNGFSSAQLLKKIQSAPNFPQDIFPQLYPGRMEVREEYLYIAPYHEHVEQHDQHPGGVYRADREEEVQQQEMLELRLYFRQQLVDTDIEDVARILKESLCDRSALRNKVLTISALGRYTQEEIVEAVKQKVVEQWKKRVIGNRGPIPALSIDEDPEQVLARTAVQDPVLATSVNKEPSENKKAKPGEAVGQATKANQLILIRAMILLLALGATIATLLLLGPEQKGIMMTFVWLNVTRTGAGSESVNGTALIDMMHEQVH